MSHPYQISSDSDHKDQSIASPSILLPTKVSQFRQLDGSVAYEAFPRGQASRWTAQPVLQWLESLAAATEASDLRGAFTVGGMRLSDPTPAVVVPITTRPTVSFPRVSDDAVCSWDLSYIDYLDPMAWMYTRQIKSLAGHFEVLASMATGAPIARVPTAETENLAAAYRMVQTRMAFTFDRIMGQYRQNYPPDIILHTDPVLAPPASGTETGEGRALLDTLYEETIQKLKTLIADQQAYQQRGSVGSAQPKNSYHSTQPPIKQASQHQSKQELAKYMTSWLRANFTNPYPDDEGLIDMAAQCGTTNQVISNWLINARTRKWRPAIIKASEMGRPADLLLEDSINIFDGKPLREINPMEYYKKPQQQRARDFEEPSYDEYLGISRDEEMAYEDPQPFKRYRSNY